MRPIEEVIQERILVLDGAMGTMVQQAKLSDEAYKNPLTGKLEIGVNELINLNSPETIENIHRAYIEAGADIIEANTFCANAFSLEEHGLASMVKEINLAACAIAKKARGDKPVYIAGDIGPTKESLSLSTKLEDPAWRDHDAEACQAMYLEQILALMDGGVDILIIETVFDTMMAKCAVLAAEEAFRLRSRTLPIMVSVTFGDKSGRMLCGQDINSLIVSFSGYPLFSLGCNCSTGAEEMVPSILHFAKESPFYVSAHPNAGFPDENGDYQVTPEMQAEALRPAVEQGALNILGGCCGTTPEHIKAIKQLVEGKRPHKKNERDHVLRLASLDTMLPEKGKLMVIGERTNVAGSQKFSTLASEGKWDEALAIARKEVEDGASVLDICMDAPLLDAKEAMVTFLRVIESDPAVNRIPVMIDSSDFSVIKKAMGEIAGKAIINSISLKEGEQKFLNSAHEIARYGHAMVVMLFDESGQADTFERKIACAKRSYDLLVSHGIRPEDIIFDPNVLAIATGIPEHDAYARDFLRAVDWIHQNLPYAHTSGGISNLSFSFRGNNAIRSAMHALFLHLSSLDMAIVNPSSNRDVSTLDPEAIRIITDALLLKDSSSMDSLIAFASTYAPKKGVKIKKASTGWKSLPPRERLSASVVEGDEAFLQEDLTALEAEDPLALVEGPLMDGMKEVGKLFGEGKLYLPQVVRCARTMRLAVDILQPRIKAAMEGQSEGSGHQHKKIVVMATVKGDVHDIGKNICELVLACNNYEVFDLGVMVDAETIYRAAEEHHADLVALSGLITPSLGEMAKTITLFQQRGSHTPIFVGGATTSSLHTALKLAPLYDAPVIQTSDASAMVLACGKATGSDKEAFFHEMSDYYRSMEAPQEKLSRHSLGDALKLQTQKAVPTPSSFTGIVTITYFDIEALVERIEYGMLVLSLGMKMGCEEADKVIKEARSMAHEAKFLESLRQGCRAVYGVFPAHSDRMTITIGEEAFPMYRNEATGLSLSDDVASEGDAAGLFVLSSELSPVSESDPYRKVLFQLLYDRMAEVLAGEVERRLVAQWGCPPVVIRPAPGYPSCPDHREKRTLFRMLDATSRIGVRLTENDAMDPASSICALVLSSPKACYFSVGVIGEEQKKEYEQRSVER